LEAKKDELII